ncbi:Toxin HigB-2 [Neochlamydia sp. AcF65]|uniref:type II toxin-antitoxin system RelE/ParE family toxin n=1 Tax=Neochlamydia sp. AcF65 TaxID=2795735 RepID=UPI001BC8CEB6|nr:type II toxin-antitoxin system RelE/ParE family toxin [Neochlamydia sp. AcF65]MBS4166076.1 Toxin HigB-2 [Neochlamydia sp. AcF65]
MKRQILQTKIFEEEIERLIKKRKLKKEDFDDFKKSLAENPEQGDVITGTGGIRKARLKSTSKGKRGGFRVCYLNIEDRVILFLLFIYSKNEQENLSQEEKGELKQIAEAIKKRIKNE